MSGDAKKTTGAGVSKEAIECRWFEAPSAPSVVRLIARERRWSGRSNLDWQGEYLSDVVAFVRESLGGGVLPVIVTPAGTLTATLEQEVTFTDEGWAAARSDLLQQIHGCLPHGNTKATLLIGVDGRKMETKSVQTAMWWEHGSGIDHDAITLKIHPASGERLLGTRLSLTVANEDPLLGRSRCIRHKIMPLVCHELAIFGGRSEAAVTDEEILDRRAELKQLVGRKDVHYVAALAHTLGMHSAGAFLDSMRKLSTDEDVTVVVSGFVEEDNLESVARRFAPVGPEAKNVATVLVD